MMHNDTKSQATPKVEVTNASDRILWVKVNLETAAQVAGGKGIKWS